MKSEHPLLVTPYLNTRAFVHFGAPTGCCLRALDPRAAQTAIAGASAIGGVVPVGGLREIDPLVNYVGAYGIACAGPVDSVLFFSKQPFDAFDGTSRVALTTDSMTSVRLLYLLFSYRRDGRGGWPEPVSPDEPAEGELAIGDRALRMRRAASYPYVLDLAEAWYRHHGLPMVFARWVIRKDAPRAIRARVHEWLVEFARRETALLDRTAVLDGARAGLDPVAARRYLRRIRTVLQPEDLRGQRLYERDLARHDYFAFLDAPAVASIDLRQVST